MRERSEFFAVGSVLGSSGKVKVVMELSTGAAGVGWGLGVVEGMMEPSSLSSSRLASVVILFFTSSVVELSWTTVGGNFVWLSTVFELREGGFRVVAVSELLGLRRFWVVA